LVRAICDLPFPVIAGIGHHQDQPLLCYAADVAVSTPTAAAVALGESWQLARQQLDRAVHTIMQAQTNALAEARYTVQRALNRTALTMQTVIAAQRGHVRELAQRIVTGCERALVAAKQKINLTEQVIKANDPARHLRLGYSLVRHRGALITNSNQVHAGDTITITLADGALDSTVTTIHPN